MVARESVPVRTRLSFQKQRQKIKVWRRLGWVGMDLLHKVCGDFRFFQLTTISSRWVALFLMVQGSVQLQPSHLHSRQRVKDRAKKKTAKTLCSGSDFLKHTYCPSPDLSPLGIATCKRCWKIWSLFLFWDDMCPAKNLGFPLLCK